MLSGSHDNNYQIPPQKSLQIKQDDKFFTKLLSKEKLNPKGEGSFRVLYYGGNSSAIPFMWESQPGTPKHPHSFSSLPPLTPPPSYQFSPKGKSENKDSKARFTFNIFKKNLLTKKNYVSPKTTSSSSMCSSCLSGSCISEKKRSFDCPKWCLQGASAFCFGVKSGRFCKETKGSHSKLIKMKFPF